MASETIVRKEIIPYFQTGNELRVKMCTSTHQIGDTETNQWTKEPMMASMALPLSPMSPVSPNKDIPSRPKFRRKTSSTDKGPGNTSRRPQYSRKYSTPPSRPLSPIGYPQLLDVPDLDLNSPIESSFILRQRQNPKKPSWHRDLDQNLTVDTAPQEPDIFEEPETDYFTSSEIPAISRTKHRGQDSVTRANIHLGGSDQVRNRHLSSARNQVDTVAGRDVDSDWSLPPTPGSFMNDEEIAHHRRQPSTSTKLSFAAAQRKLR